MQNNETKPEPKSTGKFWFFETYMEASRFVAEVAEEGFIGIAPFRDGYIVTVTK